MSADARGGRFASPERSLLKIVLLLCCWLSLPAVSGNAAELMLPQVYTGQVDICGWLMSEKLDGVLGYWDGKQLLSKNGNSFYPPAAFVQGLPSFPVEGEILGGRGTFEKAASIIKQQQPDDGWLQLKFAIFDVPQAPGGFTARLSTANAGSLPIPPLMLSSSNRLRCATSPTCSRNCRELKSSLAKG